MQPHDQGWGQPYQQPYPQPAPSNGGNGAGIALVAALVVLLVALVGAIAYFVGSGTLNTSANSGDAAPVTVIETQTMQRAAQPSPAAAPEPVAPVARNSCPYSNYSAANGVTSAGFAANVYSAFIRECGNNGGPNVSLTAYSPATGINYNMSCSGSGTVYCRGGDNAVVKIW
ncbi:hypothetical protein [Corynebacterium liangguodongii]|uniref:Uncharacterized protein n=1 Tax=Corynebacterium liangguodongii TaxID=2079535 RepID=A0A2S0WD28_9CORY|nr:hypothetical protein [Corynebacterium liangguodongii]AWB83660.1 hypothetical protein C3E79_03465 [Corynebacterium liangguodongii]PWB99531.1 hypothetical protein DF219_06330 [Corynebacterium liangguodongii]